MNKETRGKESELKKGRQDTTNGTLQIGHYKWDMTHRKGKKNKDELMDTRTSWKKCPWESNTKKKKIITQKHSLKK